MVVLIVEQDIFKMPRKYPIVHSVSLDMEMKNELACEIFRRYQIGRSTESIWVPAPPSVGSIGVSISTPMKCVIGLITKEKYHERPSRINFAKSLRKLKDFCIFTEIPAITIPYGIGCGHDKMHWPLVYNHIKYLFGPIKTRVYICKKK